MQSFRPPCCFKVQHSHKKFLCHSSRACPTLFRISAVFRIHGTAAYFCSYLSLKILWNTLRRHSSVIQQICLIFEEYQILEDKSISFSFYHMPLSIKGNVDMPRDNTSKMKEPGHWKSWLLSAVRGFVEFPSLHKTFIFFLLQLFNALQRRCRVLIGSESR